jgi:CHASE1-domain containing sensor protein/two-component sensor histidine kinase
MMVKIAPFVVFLIALTIGIATSITVNASNEKAAQAQFDRLADEISNGVETKISEHLLILRATASYFSTSEAPVNSKSFQHFISGLDIRDLYSGVQAIGFAQLIRAGDEGQAGAIIKQSYGFDRAIRPVTGGDLRTPIVFIEPSEGRNLGALGYDMFSDVIRRKAMMTAMENGAPTATGPVTLVTEVGSAQQHAFLVYLPVIAKSPMSRSDSPALDFSGFVYAPFRAGDFHNAVLKNINAPAVIKTMDITDTPQPLYETQDFASIDQSSGYKAVRVLNFAGRKWQLNFAATPLFALARPELDSHFLQIMSLLLAATLGLATYAQLKSLSAAKALAEISLKASEDKDMLLQEMKHRIKNSIARVLAIARQTASSASDITSFTHSFTARLQAMSAAQDLLTRTNWERADLRELLHRELRQVLGDDYDEARLQGPTIHLNERATQALGLTFHELATNTLKYGKADSEGGGVVVCWKVAGSALHIEWQEPLNGEGITSKTGFGTKLIRMNIERELCGKFENINSGDLMSITMKLPLKSLA